MRDPRSLDNDGLDGIFEPGALAKSGPRRIKGFWGIAAIVVASLGVFVLKNLPQAPPVVVSAQTPSQSTAQSPAVVSPTETGAAPSVMTSRPAPAVLLSASANQAPAQPIAAVQTIAPDAMPGQNSEAVFTLFFKFDSVKPSKLSKAQLARLSKTAKGCPKQIRVTGYTCNLGNDASNTQLGLSRAMVVKNLLIRQGIPASRIVTASAGMYKPAAPNQTRSGRMLNRRVELSCLEQ